jgi:hypothetical protein
MRAGNCWLDEVRLRYIRCLPAFLSKVLVGLSFVYVRHEAVPILGGLVRLLLLSIGLAWSDFVDLGHQVSLIAAYYRLC